MLSYLEEVTLRLATGTAALPEAFRRRQIAYLCSAQQDDGGFAGRQGGSDLYYTGFALRGLAVLGVLENALAERAAAFLRSRLAGHESVIDFVSLIYGAALLEAAAGIDVLGSDADRWRDSVADILESLRRGDGGYAKGPRGQASSTYHTFLVLVCRQLLERPIPQPEGVVQFVRSQQAEGGGFREIRVSKRAGTNPTAAAVATLRILDALDDDTRAATVGFLAEMQTGEGGLRANTRIPVADLLSSFTGLLTLMDVGAGETIDRSGVRRYAQSLEQRGGGFRGAAWDVDCDVEYSFYGMGCLALLGDRTTGDGPGPAPPTV